MRSRTDKHPTEPKIRWECRHSELPAIDLRTFNEGSDHVGRIPRQGVMQTKSLPHPAKFSSVVLDKIAELLTTELEHIPTRPFRAIDPYAGVGGVHSLAIPNVIETVGVELEPEWAHQHPNTICANIFDILTLFPIESFDAVVTSPSFANRMADAHDAQEICKQCRGQKTFVGKTCPRCNGAGRNTYKRITYRHYLGRMPSIDSSSVLQWGEVYRTHHQLSWALVVQLLKPGGVFYCNIKDHIRGGEVQPVTLFHIQTLEDLGLVVEKMENVDVPGMRFGENRDARVVEGEWVVVLRKPK